MSLPNVMITKKVHVDDSLFASVKVYVTGVPPIGKRTPGLCVDVSVILDISVAVGGVQKAFVPVKLLDVKKMLSGHPTITGGSVSTVKNKSRTIRLLSKDENNNKILSL